MLSVLFRTERGFVFADMDLAEITHLSEMIGEVKKDIYPMLLYFEGYRRQIDCKDVFVEVRIGRPDRF